MPSLHNASIPNVRAVFLAGRVAIIGFQGVIGEVSTKLCAEGLDRAVRTRLHSANGANQRL